MTAISVFQCFSQHPIGAASEQILKDVRIFSDNSQQEYLSRKYQTAEVHMYMELIMDR